MNRTYQPSGKISPLFWPAAAAMFVITAAAALLCAFGIQASYATLLDITIYSAITKYLANFGTFLCVKSGRVRKPAFAKASGIALAVWYWLFLIGFTAPVKAVLAAEDSVWVWKWGGAWKEALVQYGRDFCGDTVEKGKSWMDFAVWQLRLRMFWEQVLSLKNTGAIITGKSGNTLFIMPGIVSIVLLGIVFLAAAWQFGFAFWKQGRAPFCEVSGKWAKETMVNLRYGTEETVLSRLLLGDTTVLADLEPLGSMDTDCYFKVSMFTADRSTTFYVSVSKMIKVERKRTPRSADHPGDKPQRRKKLTFKEEQVAEYLVLDRGTGLSLLSRSQMEKSIQKFD